MAPVDVLQVGRQIASSLDEAHDRGLVHRDLKPGNIMICPQRHDPLFVKVLDFGLVKLVTEEQAKKLTQSGIMMGSPRYMSPEQVRGIDNIDHRADIYSFGALLPFCLAGRPPFPDGSQFEAMRHHVYTAPPTIRTLNPRCTVSDELEATVLRCLAKNPAERFQSMAEVLAAFERCPEAGGATDAPVSYDDGGRTSVDLLPASGPASVSGDFSAPVPGVPASNPETDSQVSQISSSWFRKADGSSLGTAGWLIRGLIAATILLSGAAAAFFVPQLMAPEPRATPLPPLAPPPVAPAAPATEGETEPAEPDVSQNDPGSAGAMVMLRPVRIVTDPPGALVTHEGETLGTTPVDLEVTEDEPLLLSIEREGHDMERLRVDGSQDLIRIELTPTEAATEERPDTGRRRTPETTRMRRGDDPGGMTKVIRDPWG